MGQEKDVLIIKSDKKWKDFFEGEIFFWGISLIWVNAILIYCAVNMPDPNKEEGRAMCIVVGLAYSMVIILYIYRLFRKIDRELILDKTGFWLKHGFIKESIHGMNFKLSN